MAAITKATSVLKFRRRTLASYSLVNTLKDVSKQIRRKRVDSLALVILNNDGTFASAFVGADGKDETDRIRLLGCLRTLEYEILRAIDRDNEG